uniref:Putative secreted protein n=1 Tax=Ixodes scapularis TaxID=6945 RepID=A0A4D5RVH0_IXOSC
MLRAVCWHSLYLFPLLFLFFFSIATCFATTPFYLGVECPRFSSSFRSLCSARSFWACVDEAPFARRLCWLRSLEPLPQLPPKDSTA